ncbi:PHP domain-containing protein [Rhodococcus sp. HNM0569]|uniref:PHP domain-containing protein n=1 Tax=Rhodococcus sp. HNM0569 TaxID=2716340 RepID=UPI00146CB75E|nr:PHP domain-containing protein [Rhodococcus sp. HNM0569]NLU83888.1 PHP domain-containing protein [Rhodococcus sp. HNM0569]
MRIDLHTHSTASDGTDSPAELVAAAGAAELDVVAVTDHDTTAGWSEAVAARPSGVALVRGMEMSCTGRGDDGFPVAVHLLAYLFDPSHDAFAAERERLREERVWRILEMAARMSAAGLPVDGERIVDEAGPSVGRPHLARALIDAGIVPSIDAAFAGPLSRTSPYFVDKHDTRLSRAVDLVVASGGVAVVAHPRARARGRLLAVAEIRELAERGLGGVEVFHPDHTAADVDMLVRLARELDLVTTGSSDYHGTNKSVRLGDFTTPPDQFAAIEAAATGVPVVR